MRPVADDIKMPFALSSERSQGFEQARESLDGREQSNEEQAPHFVRDLVALWRMKDLGVDRIREGLESCADPILLDTSLE
jgi:hypothetical protein